MPAFMPTPADGLQTWAASPASSTRPTRKRLGHPAMDPERAAIDDLADAGAGHVARERGLRCLRAGEPRGVVAEVEPPAAAGEGPGPHRVGPQEHEDLVRRTRPPVDRRVDDRPDAGVVLSVEGQAEALAHGAVHAVAADQPARADRRPLAAGVPEGGRHAGAVVEEIEQLPLALDRHGHAREVPFQNALGVALGKGQPGR